MRGKPTFESLCSDVPMELGLELVAQNPTHQDVKRFKCVSKVCLVNPNLLKE